MYVVVSVFKSKSNGCQIIDGDYKISGFINIAGDFYKTDDLDYIKVENQSKKNLEKELSYLVKFKSNSKDLPISKEKFLDIEKKIILEKN